MGPVVREVSRRVMDAIFVLIDRLCQNFVTWESKSAHSQP